jgi:hypothetical protein
MFPLEISLKESKNVNVPFRNFSKGQKKNKNLLDISLKAFKVI